ncbi:MAG: glycine dehydrogenase (aminomethyl-transferring) [Gammaproteobacteria bacterium]|nr:glycine dehydrogenase (aminomethyl-transferring) [Gammaproteobacteria bacterium]
MAYRETKTIFELGEPGRVAGSQQLAIGEANDLGIPAQFLRNEAPLLPSVSELQSVRHFTGLSRKNFSIDTQFYPLGSCTMKYNPRGAHAAANFPEFLNRHPLSPESISQGFLECMHDLQTLLEVATGMQGVSLTPMAGAQGELAGVAMIRAYHKERGDDQRREILVPKAAHGTNPATAVMCGYEVVEVSLDDSGDVDIAELSELVGPQTAGIMLTNPSTCGVFERRIREIADIIHEAGGLLYYDGANLNAILGQAKPGDMGFDVLHMNLHKTFATPHGGGGPGAGPVGVGERLLPYLPIPFVEKRDGEYGWATEEQRPLSIGRLSAFMGNAGILLRALSYGLMLGQEGLRRVGEYATLNANYLSSRLANEGFDLAYPERRATHEFVVTFANIARSEGITAMDIAKRLLDYGVHAPTTYFPLLIPECFLIEPTETETKAELDAFISALATISQEVIDQPEMVKAAPHSTPVKRLDDVRAARDLDLVWKPSST